MEICLSVFLAVNLFNYLSISHTVWFYCMPVGLSVSHAPTANSLKVEVKVDWYLNLTGTVSGDLYHCSTLPAHIQIINTYLLTH